MPKPADRLVASRLTDGVAVLTLADPGHRNALSRRLSDELAAAVGAALSDGARALVLTAEPPVFCAGGSLNALLERADPLREMFAGMTAVATAPVPTIAAVGGPAIGAGVNLPLACDIVITTPQARFDPRFLDVGIHPGGGHLFRLAGRVGAQGAAAMVLCGDVLTGPEAVERGLAWRCVAESELAETAMALAARAAARPARLVRRTKESLRRSLTLTDPEQAFALELQAQEWSMDQPEFAEALARVRLRITAARR
ncbi:enoyl-CoA hydratase-related protein [Streptomyces sp. WMMC500]|uniref:enoyl-CoA hydratase-related protein n=1 Tax=Streptomyces sp. WMMC500 TaxID=3015154 RepID=UPI00248B1A19|nr:enoyl-CoA hydratase-related protein [Streptomyces sp. WMMC500]WBB61288.1 enoyl-CoA hydratase-related protein [Streptomyces sp. WMMC500]